MCADTQRGQKIVSDLPAAGITGGCGQADMDDKSLQTL